MSLTQRILILGLVILLPVYVAAGMLPGVAACASGVCGCCPVKPSAAPAAPGAGPGCCDPADASTCQLDPGPPAAARDLQRVSVGTTHPPMPDLLPSAAADTPLRPAGPGERRTGPDDRSLPAPPLYLLHASLIC